jgi:2-hydroxychromene-2-carboxylate isomerase
MLGCPKERENRRAMPAPIEFYFDFSSPYGYLAANRIDAVAAGHGRDVAWYPFLLGAVFKVAGTQPLTAYPLKGDYSVHDFRRCARLHNIPFNMPASFPVSGLHASRAFYWLEKADPAKRKPFALAVYRAYFADGRPIGEADVVAEIGAGLGIDRAALLAGMQAPEVKQRLKEVTDDAIERRHVFGSPFVFVDGEPFWGADRLDMIDRWLATGGW